MGNRENAQAIIKEIGGSGNIVTLTHCATRLRFALKDATHIDSNKLEDIPGVLAAIPQGSNNYQVVIGGGVEAVYNDIMALPEMNNVAKGTPQESETGMSDADVKAQERAKVKGKNRFVDSFFEFLSDSFRPIIGVLLGASLIIAIVNVLIACHLIPNDTANPTLVFVQAMWKGVFYFLPLMIAYNGAKKLKVDPWVGTAVMAAVMTPQFMALSAPDIYKSVFGNSDGLKAAKGVLHCVAGTVAGTQNCSTRVFGLPLQLNDYSGNVFVPLFMVVVLALVYKGLQKIIPNSVQLVFVPFLSMIIMIPVTAFLLGPLGVWVGNGLGFVFGWMNQHVPFLFAIAIPLIYPFLVPLGLHWPLNALMLANIQSLGYDFIQGPMGTWNFACFGATLGVLILAIRDKDVRMRETAAGALAAGLLGGVSEPSLYGIHLRFKKIYSRMLVGCGAGGVTIAILGWLFPSSIHGGTVRGVTTGVFAFTSLLTIPVFNQMWVYAVSILVAFCVSAFMIVVFDYRTPEEKAAIVSASRKSSAVDIDKVTTAPSAGTAESSEATRTEHVFSPLTGRTISLEDAGDKVFASHVLGDGVGLVPDESKPSVYAPVSGILKTVAETGHAYGIKTDDGVEILVHVGIDTVKLKGEGFAVAVAKGDRVNAGDKLVDVDYPKIRAAGYKTTTIMTVANTKKMNSVIPHIDFDVKTGDPVIDIVR
ncbi:MAG: glucose PTS transporter subunit IIA [Parascardovia denticolens]